MTPLRALGPDFDSAMVAGIDARLVLVAEKERVAILLAVESGRRAWGFPSPDSDYDFRFIYVCQRDDYLSLFSPRDVIEFAPDGHHDINRWDLLKALRLLLKGNAVVIEWLASPYVYAGDSLFREEARTLAQQATRSDAVAHHYLHLGERQRRTYFADDRAVSLKKIFYALWSAVALRWLRLHAGEAVAPVHFLTLVAESDLLRELVSVVNNLLARKAETRELGHGPLPQQIGAFIDREFALARDLWPREATTPDRPTLDAANALFRRWIERAVAP